MLQAIRGEMAMLDGERARRWARRALGGAALMGTTALLCRAAGDTIGFGMAFLVAALLAGRSPAALLLGCGLGTLPLSGSKGDLAVPLGAALALGGCLVWSALEERSARGGRRSGRRQYGPRLQARSPTSAVKGAALAGGATLLPGLALAGGELVPSGAALASALAAVCAEPFLEAALAVRPGRRWLTGEERAGLLTLAGMAGCGLGTLSLPLAAALGGALAALLYPAGAAVGLGMGAALLLSGGDGAVAALPGLAGLAAQLCGGSRWVRGGVAGGAALAGVVLLRLPAPYLAVAVAALLPPLLPREARARLAGWARPGGEPCDPDRVAALARGDAAARLSALRDAFAELAEGYPGEPRTPDEQTLIHRLREALCDGCARYAECWAGEGRSAVGLMCALAAQAVEWSAGDMGEPLLPTEATPALLRRCRRGRWIPSRLGPILEDFARARRAELKRGAEDRLISAQFLQARQLLDDMAAALSRPVRLGGRLANRALAALEAAELPVASALALAGPRPELEVALREGIWDREMAAVAAARLRQALGRTWSPTGAWGRSLRFVRRPALRVRAGVACAARQAGLPSGDSHALIELEGDRLLALLCDGMGSGPEAARESAAAVRLLARLLEAGAESALAVDTVNTLLMNRGPEDMFATVDMLVLDLGAGGAEFTKLAACPTLIARDGALRRVQGGRLPLGILERVQPAMARARIAPGDALVMVSDGVWEALGPQAVAGMLLEAGPDMQALADRMLSAARAAAGPSDDMTALCLRVEDREAGSGQGRDSA